MLDYKLVKVIINTLELAKIILDMVVWQYGLSNLIMLIIYLKILIIALLLLGH